MPHPEGGHFRETFRDQRTATAAAPPPPRSISCSPRARSRAGTASTPPRCGTGMRARRSSCRCAPPTATPRCVRLGSRPRSGRASASRRPAGPLAERAQPRGPGRSSAARWRRGSCSRVSSSPGPISTPPELRQRLGITCCQRGSPRTFPPLMHCAAISANQLINNGSYAFAATIAQVCLPQFRDS